MSMWSRIKSAIGGHTPPQTLSSAATLTLPDDDNLFYLTGTTTITSLVTPSSIRNRKVTIIGGSDAEVAFTNTNDPTTAGQMYLHGQNRIVREDDVIELFCKADGTWILLNLVN